jgi:choline dehydrogenase-like flavoprotein
MQDRCLSSTIARHPSWARRLWRQSPRSVPPARHNDFNGASQEAGAGSYQSTRRPDGRRVTAGSALFTPVLKPPYLQRLIGERAIHLLIEGGARPDFSAGPA